MNWRKHVVTAFLLSGLVSPAWGESPPPFPEFQAKRVKPPKPGQRKRITVQIEPQDQVQFTAKAPEASASTSALPVVPGQTYDWFWQTTSPDIAQSGPGRLEPALVSLSNPPAGGGVRTPRLSDLNSIVQTHGLEILKATVGTQVSPALVLAVISVESGGRKDAVSGAGAQGLMQLMPATADRFGVSDSLDPADNIAGGVRFLDFLMQKFERDPILVLAGYNAGENAVTSHAGVPPFAETRDYVPKVLATYSMARAMCMTPPQLITDGCVFSTR